MIAATSAMALIAVLVCVGLLQGAAAWGKQTFAIIGDWGGVGGPGDATLGAWKPGPNSCPSSTNTPFYITEYPSKDPKSPGDEDCVKKICHYTDGTDEQENCIRSLQQRQAAYLYDRVCSIRGCEYVINTSDNFYMKGCNSTAGSWGETCEGRYKNGFVDVYHTDATPAIKGLTWYGSLGNHDVAGHKQGVEDQIKLTLKHDHNYWYLPARWYAKTIGEGDSAVHLVVLHSSCLIDGYLAPDSSYSSIDEEQYCSTPEMRDAQLDFAEKSLKHFSKQKGWTFVVLHHPPFSGDESYFYESDTYKPESSAWARLAKLVKKYKPAATLSGHDHTLTYTEAPDYKPTQFIVSGAGSFTEPNDGGWNKTSNNVVANKPWLKYSSVTMCNGKSYTGFAVGEVTPTTFEVDFYSINTGTESQYKVKCTRPEGSTAGSGNSVCTSGAGDAKPNYEIASDYPKGIPGASR